MAGKISELTAATAVASADEVELLQGGANKRATGAMWKTLVNPEAVTALTPGASVPMNWALGTIYTLASGQNNTLTFSNDVAGQTRVLAFTQDTSVRTLTFPAGCVNVFSNDNLTPDPVSGAETYYAIKKFGTGDYRIWKSNDPNAFAVAWGAVADEAAALTLLGGAAATGTGGIVRATSAAMITPALGTPTAIVLTSGTGLPISTGVSGLGTGAATALAVNVGSAGAFVTFNGAGGTPSAITLTNGTGLPVSTGVSGLGTGVATQLALNANGTDVDAVGFRGVPQNSQSAAYTTVMADAGKHLYHPGADTTARVWTIDSNANVAYEIGTTITFVNDTSGGVITIAITSDTLVLAGPGTTGSRTLAANGIATAIKMTSTRWIISGPGVS